MKRWPQLQEHAEWLEERIDRPKASRGKHEKAVTGEEIDMLVKECDEFTDKLSDAIRNEHKKFKKFLHDYQQVFSKEQHAAWHQIDDEARVLKRKFIVLRLTGW
jgi:hypothetical protein